LAIILIIFTLTPIILTPIISPRNQEEPKNNSNFEMSKLYVMQPIEKK